MESATEAEGSPTFKTYLMEISSVSAFVEHVQETCSTSHLFRGQPQDKPLLPKIARGELKPNFLREEQRLLDDFRRRCTPYLEATAFDDWDILAVAQHYGMATRLLDWTANPLVALWFAVREASKDAEDGVVWILPYSNDDIADQEKETPFEGKRTKLFQPKHITKSIVAQSGWFTVHKYMSEDNEFIPLEKNKLYKRECRKCRVPGDKFSILFKQLNQFGINASTVFPELRGLGEYLNFLHLPNLVIRRFPRY